MLTRTEVKDPASV